MQPNPLDIRFVEFPFADYLLVFISFIVGYVVTEFFAGWGSMIRNREHVRVYWLHLLWTVNFFFQLMENWWWLWGNRMKIADHVYYFFFTLASPLIFYLITVFLFPSFKANETLDFKEHYYKTSRYLFLLFALLMFSYFINNIWIKELPLLANDNIFSLIGLAFSVTLVFVRSELFHILAFIGGSVIFLRYVIENAVI